MAEYIEREAALRVLCDACGNAACPKGLISRCSYYEKMQSIPAADVAPVVRGKWEQKEVFEAKGHVDELQSAFCPVCQRYHTTPYSYYFTNYNYCPNCGADMMEES